jgi:hypothetical protein
MDYIEFDTTPSSEKCAQVGQPDYRTQAMREVHAMIGQLQREFPGSTDLVDCRPKWNSHDFGQYLTLRIYFDDTDETSTEMAYTIEAHWPEHWDTQALEAMERDHV